MCEYCGCQEIAAIGELTREHDAVVAEIAEVRSFLRDGNVEGAAKTAGRIAEILGPHTAVEEGGLFPLMAGEFPDHIEALEREHRAIEGVLSEAATARRPTRLAEPAAGRARAAARPHPQGAGRRLPRVPLRGRRRWLGAGRGRARPSRLGPRHRTVRHTTPSTTTTDPTDQHRHTPEQEDDA